MPAPTEMFERKNDSLLSKPEKMDSCPSCGGIYHPLSGECRCSP